MSTKRLVQDEKKELGAKTALSILIKLPFDVMNLLRSKYKHHTDVYIRIHSYF